MSGSRYGISRKIPAHVLITSGRYRSVVLMLLVVNAVLLAWIGYQTSPSRTEAAHMVAGLRAWQTFRFDIFHVNPPLVRAVATAPVLLCCCPKYDWASYSPSPGDRCEWPLGRAFVEANCRDDVRWCFALARWTCIPFCLFGGYMCYRFATQLYGQASGICALTLWCFSPMLLGLGATICPEVAAAGMGIAATYAFWRWLMAPRLWRALLAGLLLGVLPLTKLTWLVALAVWPALWLVWPLLPTTAAGSTAAQPPGLRQLGAILGVALLVINSGYLLEGSFRPFGRYEFISKTLGGVENFGHAPKVTGNRFAASWLGRVPTPLPANMIQGIDTQKYDFERGLPSYLRGQWADHGWWYYYLYALLIKVPAGTLCLAVLALGNSISGRSFPTSWRDEMVLLAPGLVILALVSSQTGFSVHSRYIALALPFLFVWTGKVARVFTTRPFTRRRRVTAVTVVLAVAWTIGSSLAIYPHSLSYFNELAAVLPTPADPSYQKCFGRSDESDRVLAKVKSLLTAGTRNGPRHLLGSNIDWGQDIFYLNEWLHRHPGVKFDEMALWEWGPATLVDVPEPPHVSQNSLEDETGRICGKKGQRDSRCPGAEDIRDGLNKSFQSPFLHHDQQLGPAPGWYALSVNYVYDRSRQYRHFWRFEPVARVGYSIYIYHITLDGVNRVRRELGLPDLPRAPHLQGCRWTPSESRRQGEHGGWNAVCWDGSVHTMGYDLDAEIHRRMGNRHDGLPAGQPEP